MTLDEFIKSLHGEVDYLKHNACVNKTQGAADCPSCCGEQYFDGNNPTYDCDQKRKIYVLRYLPVHIYENYRGALIIPEAMQKILFSKDVVKVLSLGGGPGSDIAGLKKFIDTLSIEDCQSCKFKIMRLDKEDGWNDISKHVIHIHGNEVREFKHYKKELDVCATSNWFDQNQFDLILISYLLSELSDVQIDTLAENLKKCMSKDALLIINDRPEGLVDGKVLRFSTASEIERIATRLNTDWACFTYDDDIAKLAKPKFSASSRVQVYQRVQHDN